MSGLPPKARRQHLSEEDGAGGGVGQDRQAQIAGRPGRADPRAEEAERASHYTNVRYQPDYAREQDVHASYIADGAAAADG